MAEFKLNINLSCDEDRMSGSWNETHGDTVNADNIKSEITSWLEDLGFTVEFGETPNNLLQDAKALITDEDIEEVIGYADSFEERERKAEEKPNRAKFLVKFVKRCKYREKILCIPTEKAELSKLQECQLHLQAYQKFIDENMLPDFEIDYLGDEDFKSYGEDRVLVWHGITDVISIEFIGVSHFIDEEILEEKSNEWI